MKKGWRWLVATFVFGLVASVIYPFYVRAQRPQRETFRIAKNFAQESRESNLLNFTRQSVVIEGPCSGGCYGGVLRTELPDNIQQSVSDLVSNKNKATNFIWLHNIKPTSVSRRNDIFGEDDLMIYGQTMNDGKNYFAAIPATLAAPDLYWIFVKTNE